MALFKWEGPSDLNCFPAERVLLPSHAVGSPLCLVLLGLFWKRCESRCPLYCKSTCWPPHSLDFVTDLLLTSLQIVIDLLLTSLQTFIDLLLTSLQTVIDLLLTSLQIFIDLLLTSLQTFIDLLLTSLQTFIDWLHYKLLLTCY